MTGQIVRWKMRGAAGEAPTLSVEIADSFARRFLGLMGRRAIGPSRALFLSPCSSVHMCFMRFAIDVVYLKREGDGEHWRTVKVVRGLRPWLGVSACFGADAVLEMRSGEAERLGIRPGAVWECL